MHPLAHRKVIVVSRCAWTLFNFRLSLIRSIDAEHARVIAFGAGGDGYEEKLREQGVEFRAIPIAPRGLSPLADLLLLVRLTREFRRERPDVVHCFTIKPAIYGTLAAWLCGVPVRVVTVTGLGHAFTSAGKWLARLVRGLYRAALAHAHRVYFQNSEDQELFARAGLVSRAKARLVAGSGIDVQKFAPVPLPSERGVPPRFLMISRLIREKGVVEFAQAAALVRRRYPQVEFALLGGKDPRNPTALTDAELSEVQLAGVRWLGETQDVREYIAQADVVVLPSYREGLPRSLLEAGAMARPVVATDTVGCRDVVVDGTTGYLVPVMDAVALADAMFRLIENREQAAMMGVAARARVVAYFDEQLVLQPTLKDYADLLGKRVTDAGTTAAA